ncbi:Alpha/Beta hydrolase protein [Mycena epipterygia]|nr:Alpha/Beta hydrolase protein [Mycena epipterygia]
MPHIDLQTSAGTGSFYYTIATPAQTSATAIVQDTPTVILIHPVYVPSHIFHPIFSDTRLRRFNLVTLDLRGHGGTTAEVEHTYGREAAARDILQLMEALKIPACHVMGVSMGACIGLEMAVAAPEKVLSLFMVSPLPLIEPAVVADGRQEIYDCWIQAFKDPDNVDKIALGDAFTGSLQLAYNNRESPLIRAIAARALLLAMRNWGPDHFGVFHAVSVRFFLDHAPRPVAELSRVQCPITLLHCDEDIAYPLAHCEELLQLLLHADLDANIQIVHGAPHFGNVTHYKEINGLLYDFVLANYTNPEIPAAPANVKSPFLAELLEAGLVERSSDSEPESSESESESDSESD